MFFSMAGIGLDAKVAADVATSKNHRGLLLYVIASSRKLLSYLPAEYFIESDADTVRLLALIRGDCQLAPVRLRRARCTARGHGRRPARSRGNRGALVRRRSSADPVALYRRLSPATRRPHVESPRGSRSCEQAHAVPRGWGGGERGDRNRRRAPTRQRCAYARKPRDGRPAETPR